MFKYKYLTGALLLLAASACKVPALTQSSVKVVPPASYTDSLPADTSTAGTIPWRKFFTDKTLVGLVDTALKNNQELLSTLQEIEIARNEITARKGERLPFVTARAAAGAEKVGRYTSQGAGDASTEITPGKEVPDILPDQLVGLYASWEVDIWKKLRNAKQAAITRFLATVEGRNFVVTNLVAEIARSYYELLALDNQAAIVHKNIELQQQALEIVKVQKQAAVVTELAVKKFEAELLSSQGMEYEIKMQVKETENRINALLGRYPQPIPRDPAAFVNSTPMTIQAGVPAQLLVNRPDIRQAELELTAAQLDVKVARAEFYPRLDITASLGLNAFNPSYLVKLPESMLFSLAGDLVGPLVNKNAIQAAYRTANAKQLQALYNYQQLVVTASAEVSTGLARLDNLQHIISLKAKEADALMQSVTIAGELFNAARADYLEVLLTQRDALETKLELNEARLTQFTAVTDVYRALGGGWK